MTFGEKGRASEEDLSSDNKIHKLGDLYEELSEGKIVDIIT